MDNLNKLIYQSINNYFNTLTTFGYKSYKDVDRLITLIFIGDLLNNKFGIYINEDEYRTIEKVLYCLFGSTCLIPYPQFYVNTSLVQIFNEDLSRMDEYNVLRFSENELFRLLND